MKSNWPVYIFVVSSFLAAIPASAHHSFGAEFDAAKQITVKGVITKVEWANPHIYFYVDVQNDKGEVVNWSFEGYPPGTLRREGWTRDSLKVGDAITVIGYAAKDGSNLAAARKITLPDGKVLYASAPPQQ